MFVTLALVLLIVAVPGIERRRTRRSQPIDEQQYFAAVHAELRAGASVREALAQAASGQGAVLAGVHRLATSGASLDEVAAELSRLPTMGAAADAAVRVAAHSGGRAAAVFLRLADRAASEADLARQRRVLTAQARLSAGIVGGLPLLWLAFGGVGRLQSLVEAGGTPVALVGVAMETVGVLMVWRLAAA
ncbi:MAG: type II secretion system F family protein [Acidimicrobiia bacterium]|nr:type II secretion system F family protein [Acidimicrobiia bacterium]